MDLKSKLMDHQENETVPKKKKKVRRSEKPDCAVMTSTAEKTVIPSTPAAEKTSTELAASSFKPAQATLPLPSKKKATSSIPSKAAGEASFDIGYSLSGELLRKVSDKRDETVDSPKPAKQNTSVLVVDVEDHSSPSKQTDTASAKKRKMAESVAHRIIRKGKGLKARNKDISEKTGVSSLQHKPREKEVDESLITPTVNPNEPASNSTVSLTVREIIRDMDSLEKQDRLLDTPGTLNETAYFGEDAARPNEAALNPEVSVAVGMSKIKEKAEELQQSRSNLLESNLLAADATELAMKPSDLIASLPSLPPPTPTFSLNFDAGEEVQVGSKDLLIALQGEVKDLREQAEIARLQEQDLRSALEIEKKERLERERTLQDQVANLAARFEREKKANRKLEDDYKYYRRKYLHLTREVGGNQRPVSGHLAAGETSNPPAVKEAKRVAVTGEAAAVRTIPAGRIERDAARLHGTFNLLHKNICQMYGLLLQAGDQVARLHREDPPLDH